MSEPEQKALALPAPPPAGNENPGSEVPDLSQAWTPREMSPRLPDDFTRADMRKLMERIYALATQI